MDNMMKISLCFLLVCLISFEGCAAQGEVTVPDTNRLLWVGDDSASFTCRATENPRQVAWYKMTDEVAKWTQGAGITITQSEDKYNMSGDGLDFELIIKNISLSDAQSYSCAALYVEDQAVFKRTVVAVNDEPNDPYPTITQCPTGTEGNDGCHLTVLNETDTQNLTCMATHFFPNVTLTWSKGGETIEPNDIQWYSNDDGSYCASIMITVSPQDEEYVCTVTGEAVRNVASKIVSAVVQIQDHESTTNPGSTKESDEDDPGPNNVGLIVGIVIAVIFCVMVVLCLIYFLKVKRRGSSGKSKPYTYSGVQDKEVGTVEELDEQRAKTSKSSTGKEKSGKDKDDKFAISEDINETEDPKKREKPKEDDNEKSPESKPSVTVDDHGHHGGHGGGHTDHHDHGHSHSGGGGGGGGGHSGGHSDHHDHSSGGGGGGGYSSGGGGGGYSSGGGGGGGGGGGHSGGHDHGD